VNSLLNPPINTGNHVSGIQIFLVDDYQPVLWGLAKLIEGEYPHLRLIGKANSREAALAGVIRLKPDVVLLDHKLAYESSLDFLSQLAVQGQHRILFLTGQNYSAQLTRQTLALGACGVISKEAPAELLLHAIDCAHWQGAMSELFNQTSPVSERRITLRQ
jgi:two-component system, NarL family, nitrate/nitrite response regulator NarL